MCCLLVALIRGWWRCWLSGFKGTDPWKPSFPIPVFSKGPLLACWLDSRLACVGDSRWGNDTLFPLSFFIVGRFRLLALFLSSKVRGVLSMLAESTIRKVGRDQTFVFDNWISRETKRKVEGALCVFSGFIRRKNWPCIKVMATRTGRSINEQSFRIEFYFKSNIVDVWRCERDLARDDVTWNAVSYPCQNPNMMADSHPTNDP